MAVDHGGDKRLGWSSSAIVAGRPDGDYRSALEELCDPAATMGRLSGELLALVPAADGVVVGLSGEDGRIVFVHAAGAVAGFEGITKTASSLSGLAMRTNTVLCCEDAASDPRVDRVVLEQLGMASEVCVPLVREGRAFGVVNVLARRPGAFSEQDRTTCAALAESLAGVISVIAELTRIVDRLGWNALRAAGDEVPAGSIEAVSRFVTRVLSPASTERAELRHRIEQTVAERQFSLVYQPILELGSDTVVALEALSRFEGPEGVGPDHYFAEAAEVGLGDELELAAIELAFAALDRLPDEVGVSVNVGPSALAAERLAELLAGRDARRIVFELTEHAPVRDYDGLLRAIAPLRDDGARLCVDDTGAGFASLAHIVRLAPAFIKLDRWIVAGVDADPVRRALVVALVRFAHDLGARVVGEGIETAAEQDALVRLGVDYGQGFYLARPAPLERFC